MLNTVLPVTLYYSPFEEGGANGETSLSALLKNMHPELNKGEYVFCTINDDMQIDRKSIICYFKEAEGTTLILDKTIADSLHLPYSYIASWITLTIHSSLEATGLTAAFSKALAEAGISCNVVAAYYHDHIFVDKKDGERAMGVLRVLAANSL